MADPDDDLRPICPVCHRTIRLRKDGTLRAHGRAADTGDGRRWTTCRGTGKAPA